MARHAWLVGKFSDRLMRAASYGLDIALGRLAHYDDLARWVGYLAETALQEGGYRTIAAVRAMWDRLVASGHQYAKARNRDNYHKAGTRLLAYMHGLSIDTPAGVVFDRLLELGKLPQHWQ